MLRILTTLLFCFVSAQAVMAESVSLRDAVSSAVEKRPYVLEAHAHADAADAAAGEALSGYLPHLTASETFVRTNEPGSSLFINLNQQELVLSPTADPYNFPPTRSDFETRLQLDQQLINVELGYAIARARSGAAAAQAGADWSREEAAFAAFSAYLGVQQAHGVHEWAESSLQEAGEMLRLADLRQRNGIGLKSDTLRARVYEAEAQRRHQRAENDLILARRRLALAMGKPGGEVEIATPLHGELFPETSLEKAERSDLTALMLKSRAARQQLSSTRARWLPSLGVSASYSGHDPDAPGFDADSWMVSGRLSWSLFDGLQRERSQQRSAAEFRAAGAAYTEAVRAAELALQEAELRADEARLQFTTAERAVAEAEESYHLLKERYAAGLSDLSDLLGVQAALDRTRADLVMAEAGLVQAQGNIHFQRGGFVAAILPEEVNE